MDPEFESGVESRTPSSSRLAELLEELKHKIRQMLQPYVCVSLSSLPTLYDQQYKSKLSPEDYGISGEFSLTRLLRKMPDIVAVAPAMDPFKGAIIIPLPPGAVVVHPPLPPDLRQLVDMSGTELGSNCGDDEDPYWVKYQEDRASEMLVAIVHQVCLPSFDPNLRSSRLLNALGSCETSSCNLRAVTDRAYPFNNFAKGDALVSPVCCVPTVHSLTRF